MKRSDGSILNKRKKYYRIFRPQLNKQVYIEDEFLTKKRKKPDKIKRVTKGALLHNIFSIFIDNKNIP